MTKEVLKQVKVLYVEDDNEIRPIVERGLRRRVKELAVAVDGLDGLEKYKTFAPDIILTDIKMPNMDGLEMSEKIKSINKDIQIIIMSAHSESEFLFRSIDMGIDGYLLKPVDKDKMFEKLVHAAKNVLYEKKELEHQQLIQELIDLQPSIIFSADDENSLMFVNKTFINFFCCDSKIENIDTKELNLSEFFDKFCDNMILQNTIDGVNWVQYLLEHPNTTVNLDFVKNGKKFRFVVHESVVEYSSGKKHMIMTLTNLE